MCFFCGLKCCNNLTVCARRSVCECVVCSGWPAQQILILGSMPLPVLTCLFEFCHCRHVSLGCSAQRHIACYASLLDTISYYYSSSVDVMRCQRVTLLANPKALSVLARMTSHCVTDCVLQAAYGKHTIRISQQTSLSISEAVRKSAPNNSYIHACAAHAASKRPTKIITQQPGSTQTHSYKLL